MTNRQKEKKVRETAPFQTGQVVDLSIEGLDEEGLGIARTNEATLKVIGSLPGEQVRAKIVDFNRQRGSANVVKVLRHSPDRLLSSPCPHLATCDGCSLIRMKYRSQLEWKMQLLSRELGHYFNPGDLDIRNILASPKTVGYRNSAKLVVAGRHAAPVIGIYRRNTHDIADISECPLHHPLINRIVDAAKDGIRRGKVPIYSQRTGNGLLRYLVIRVSEKDSKAMVTLVTAHRSFNEIHHLAKHLQAAIPEITIILQNVNASSGNVIFGQKDYFLTREQVLTDMIGPVRFAISPRSFFQINSGGARLIYEQVAAMANLSGTEKVIDLYCGVGGISFFLAGRAKEVVGIESVAPAVADAEENARLNGITNCRFIAGDAMRILAEIAEEGTKSDVVVMNPPRKGCDEQVLQQAARIGPDRMIYVSCSPRSLGHDLGILYTAGYAPVTIQPIDMFPQTPHMETVVLLGRR